MYSDYMAERLGPARDPAAPVEKVHRDGAATLQARLEEVLFEMLRALHARTKQKAVCLAGGVAFNCVANGKIFDQTPFEQDFRAARRGRCGARDRRRLFRASSDSRPAALFRHGKCLLGAGLLARADARGGRRQPLARRGHGDFRASRRSDRQGSGEGNRRRKNSRLVSRPGRVGTARAGKSQHRRRSAPAGHEGNSERQDQAPGNVPAVRAVDPRGIHGRIFREILSVSRS